MNPSPPTTSHSHTHAQIFRGLASGAESGWDFSSRWLSGSELGSIATHDVVPVDLNAILFVVENMLSDMHTDAGNTTAADMYAQAATNREK